jgi:adenylate cyclase
VTGEHSSRDSGWAPATTALSSVLPVTRSPLPSAGRRFLQRFGFSLVQAALFGSLVGLLVYNRPASSQAMEEESSLSWPRIAVRSLALSLESWELSTYDWRARSLGRQFKPSKEVKLVLLNDYTLEEARKSDHPGIASHPWPREIVGGVTRRLVEDGAELVMLDLLFSELSPRACLTQGLSTSEMLDDDRAFRQLLDQHPQRSVLAFSWSLQRDKLPPEQLWTQRVRLGSFSSEVAARPLLQEVLADQRPAFLIPVGRTVEVWAAVSGEQEAQLLSEHMGQGGAPRLVDRQSRDEDYRVSALDLFLSLAEVQVEGLDVKKLMEVKRVQHPITPLLGEASLYGGVSARPDVDGAVRAVPHLVVLRSRDAYHVLPSMPLVSAMRLVGSRKLRYAEGRLHVGEGERTLSVPMEPSGFSLVRWDVENVQPGGGRRSVFELIHAVDVVKRLFSTRDNLPQFSKYHDLAGSAVVFTNNSTYALDFKPTPVGPKTPGGVVLAQSLLNLLRSEGITRAPIQLDLLLTLGLAFVGAFLSLSLSSLFRSGLGAFAYFLSLAVAGGAWVFAGWYLFLQQQLWVALVGPLLAMAASFLATTVFAFRTERQVRQFVTSVLGRYVSPDVARVVARDLSLVRPERRQVTIFFSDIEGFTRLSEQLSPERLVALLNDYFTEMARVVRSTGGQVDKYIGDAVMAFWGAPVRMERHAHGACRAALDMRAVLRERQADWERTYGHRLSFRSGINTGEVLVGDMGSDLKSNYTVIGDAVNLASRLEGANKAYGTTILVGDSTAQLAQDAYVFREVDRVRVKGKTVASRVHELVGRHGELSTSQQSQLTLWQEALTAYHERRFSEALGLFERSAAEFNDPVAAVYVERCRHFIDHPPPEDWDGVHDLEQK